MKNSSSRANRSSLAQGVAVGIRSARPIESFLFKQRSGSQSDVARRWTILVPGSQLLRERPR